MRKTDKTELRGSMRDRLAAQDGTAREAASLVLRREVSSLPGWNEARVVAAFAALPSEPDLRPWEWAAGKTVLLPRVEGGDLTFHAVTDPGELRAGAYGVMEPDASRCAAGDPAQSDIILVPGLAFTAEGRRLGRGRGFYDRLLARLPPRVLRVGVCFRIQLVQDLPVEAHDQRVDVVLTPPA